MPLRIANIGLALHNIIMAFLQMGGHAGGHEIQMGGPVPTHAHPVEPPLVKVIDIVSCC